MNAFSITVVQDLNVTYQFLLISCIIRVISLILLQIIIVTVSFLGIN